MRRGRIALITLLIVLSAIFCWGIGDLISMRFERGDIYPTYSSYRTDPRGCKAFFDGLRLEGAADAIRNTEPLEQLKVPAAAGLFVVGLPKGSFFHMDEPSVEALEKALSQGLRLVISFAPVRAKDKESAIEESASGEKPIERQGAHPGRKAQPSAGPSKDDPPDKEAEPPIAKGIDLGKRWGMETEELARQSKTAPLAVPGRGPYRAPWLSSLVFKPLDTTWQVLATLEDKPVIITKPFGKGEIVLLSDSFLFTNEAMKAARSPYLLAWLCRGRQTILFDETHLGVIENPGVAAVIKRNGLLPFFASLVILALLVIWRQSSAFLPPMEASGDMSSDRGRGYSAGLANLFRRNIPKDKMLTACLDEWERSLSHGRTDTSTLLPKARRIITDLEALPRKDRNLTEAYNRLSGLLSRKSEIRRYHG
jgi:hypothetical protein